MLEIIFEILKFFLIVSLVTALISLINARTEAILLSGTNSVIRFLFSFIGTPLHELSHAFMCLVFGHKITDMRLLILDPNSNVAGYVSHTYNKNNFYQNLGNFFIGIAPILGGFLTVSIIYKQFMISPKQISFWISLLICQQIIIHMRCSKQDIMNSLYGAATFAMIIAIIGIFFTTKLQSINEIVLKYGFAMILVSGINYLICSLITKRC